MKKQLKAALSLFCAIVLVLALSVTALAAGYTYQGNQGQSLMLQSPADITTESEDGVYMNAINTVLNCTEDITLKFTMSSGMTNFSEETFLADSFPKIMICDTYGGETVAVPTYVSGSSAGIELVIPAGTLSEGSYVLVFGKDIRANNPSKTLGQDIVFRFTVSASASPETPDDVPPSATEVDCPYTDVSPDRAEAVMALVENGYLVPQSDTVFDAEQPVVRGDFIALLGRCRNINTGKYTSSSYSDVADDDAVMPYLEWATTKGIISGYGDGRFGPSDKITREQAACVLYAYSTAFGAENKDASLSIGSFADKDAVSPWAKNAVKWAVAVEILSADDSNQLNPGDAVTREEMAAMLYTIVGIQ